MAGETITFSTNTRMQGYLNLLISALIQTLQQTIYGLPLLCLQQCSGQDRDGPCAKAVRHTGMLISGLYKTELLRYGMQL